MLTSEVEVPRELQGWTVHKARWRGSVRWHPVWDVPRVPRRLPESDLEPPAQLMRGAGGPPPGGMPMHPAMMPPGAMPPGGMPMHPGMMVPPGMMGAPHIMGPPPPGPACMMMGGMIHD